MDSETTLNERREYFCNHVQAKENALHGDSANSDEANKHVDAIMKVVSEWDKENITADVLAPLLDDARPEIRCAAARQLLNRGYEEKSTHILHSMHDDPRANPTTKLDARRALRWWQKQRN